MTAAAPRWMAVGAAAAVLGGLFWPTFTWMAERFTVTNSDYSHGVLIPFVSAVLVWRKRQQLWALPRVPAWYGLPLFVAGVVVHLAALHWKVHFVTGFALLLVLTGAVAHVWGRTVLQACWFPLAFLVFMVPLPSVWLISLSFYLKLIAASVATAVVQWLGVPATHAGSIIQLPASTVVVDDTCSGIRSLISLLAVGALGAHVAVVRRGWAKPLFVLAAIPVAWFANLVRIVGTVLGTFVYGPWFAEGWFHTASGMVVFGIGVGSLWALGRACRWFEVS